MPRPAHVPVLPRETLRVLNLKPGHIAVDCTLGLGGHSGEMLKRVGPGGRLVSTDFDASNLERARAHLQATNDSIRFPAQFDLVHGNFAGLPEALQALGISQVNAILADIGVASTQIDDPARGFSYRQDGPLDMRMDPTRGQPASALLARMTEQDIRDALLELGDETDAPQIAKLIVARRKSKPIVTTFDLMALVCEARDFTLARAAGAKLHPAARTFQALRILVNRELANLQRLLDVAPALLVPAGVIAIITFHSGEDRIVKQMFKDGLRAGVYDEAPDDPITATPDEVRKNARSRSAKLRWARRSGQTQ
ncbi:MAG: 16S rRNA (cytosine(1402)-N(4))-methyltransferase RsmH [Tepidisphaeraceae bacterium]